MLLAINNIEERIKPSFSGQKALCPLCRGTVIGKCGEVINWHWAHAHNNNCDNWQEHETEWHLQWKAKFPDSGQEVIIEKNGQKHIADVLTSGGLVIEFQNSSISTSTIKTREVFYGNMIWVVNADRFKDNFIITSNVNSALYTIEKKAKRQINTFDEQNTAKLERLKGKIQIIQKSIKDKDNEIIILERKIENIKNLIPNLVANLNVWIDKWLENSYFSEPYIDRVLNQIRDKYKPQLVSINDSIKENQKLFEINEQKAEELLKCEDYENSNIQHKIVNPEKIKTEDYLYVKAILKDHRNELFPTTLDFHSEYEFDNFKQKKDKYLFFINPSYYFNKFKEQIESAQATITNQTQVFNKLKIDILERISIELDLLLSNAIKEVRSLKIELNALTEDKIIAEATYSETNEELINLNMEYRRIIEGETRVNRSKAMVNNKGKYTCQWLHERTTWRVATKPIFFDIGQDYLFERIGEDEFKKVPIKEFLKRYL